MAEVLLKACVSKQSVGEFGAVGSTVGRVFLCLLLAC